MECTSSEGVDANRVSLQSVFGNLLQNAEKRKKKRKKKRPKKQNEIQLTLF